MLLDAFILLSPTIALGAFLIGRDLLRARAERGATRHVLEAAASRAAEHPAPLKKKPLRTEPVPPSGTVFPAAVDRPAKHGEGIAHDGTKGVPERKPDQPVFASARTEPPAMRKEPPAMRKPSNAGTEDTFYIDFPEAGTSDSAAPSKE